MEPQLITAWLVRFFQWKFSQKDRILSQAIRNDSYLWYPDNMEIQEQRKGIFIGTSNHWSATDANQMPGIIIKRNTYQTGQRQSIGDRYHVSRNLIGDGHNPNEQATMGQRQTLVPISGTHTVYPVAETGGSAEILGIEVFGALLDWMLVARQDLGLMEYRPQGLQPVGKLREGGQSAYTAPVVINCTYQRTTVVNQESPLLKGFTVEGTNEALTS